MTDAELVEVVAQAIAREVVDALEPLIARVVRRVVDVAGELRRPVVFSTYESSHVVDGGAVLPADLTIALDPPKVAPPPPTEVAVQAEVLATKPALPSVSGKRCQKCGELGHYGNNHAFHPAAGKPAKRMARDDDRDAAPPEVRRLKPTPAALELAEKRRIAREATPVNPRGALPTPISSWEF